MFIDPYESSSILFWNFGTSVNFIVSLVKTEYSSLLVLLAWGEVLQILLLERLEPPDYISPSVLPISAASIDVKSQDLGDHFFPLQALANLSHLTIWRNLRAVYQRLMWEQSTSKIKGTKMILATAENGARKLCSWLLSWFLGILWL